MIEKLIAGYIEKNLRQLSVEDKRRLLRAMQVLTHALQSGDAPTARSLLTAMHVPDATITVILTELCPADGLMWTEIIDHAETATDSE